MAQSPTFLEDSLHDSNAAEPGWYGDGDVDIHVLYCMGPEGFRYTGISADVAALSDVRKLIHGEHMSVEDDEFICMVNLKVVTSRRMRV